MPSSRYPAGSLPASQYFCDVAKIISEKDGFKTIRVSREELLEKLGPLGSKGLCDYCISTPKSGYYVAVLDQWLCPKCYEEFVMSNVPDPRDFWFEDERFAWFKKHIGL